MHFVDTVYHGVPKVSVAALKPIGTPYLTFMARMVPEKGVMDALTVAEQSKILLQIATSDREENTQSSFFQNVVTPRLSPGKAELVGFMDAKGKDAFLGNAIAFLFPIHWEEPFGMVMIEAMACGTPVIAYNRGSVSEIVRDGVTGFIIDEDETQRPGAGSWVIKKRGIEGLVEAVKRIGEIDRDACRRHVEENFTVDRMVDGYIKVYQKVLQR